MAQIKVTQFFQGRGTVLLAVPGTVLSGVLGNLEPIAFEASMKIRTLRRARHIRSRGTFAVRLNDIAELVAGAIRKVFFLDIPHQFACCGHIVHGEGFDLHWLVVETTVFVHPDHRRIWRCYRKWYAV
jgi:hypothetical protein